MIRRHARSGLAVLALLVAGPVAAQVGVLDQPYRNDPFQPLLGGGWSFTHYLSVGAENNTLGVGDVVALDLLADDFRPGDVFLVAGLVPAGEGIRVGSQSRSGIAFTFPAGPYLTLGIIAGGRAIVHGRVPDEVVTLIREGVEGDEITVDLTELGGQAFGYGEVGMSALVDLDLLPTYFGDLALRVGAGVRYVRSVSHVRVGFSGDDGEQTSTFTLARRGVTTDLNLAVPIGEEVLAESGSGMAIDVMVGAALGHRAQLRLAVTDLGSAEAMVGQRAITTLTLNEVSILDLGTEADAAEVTDTIPGVTRTIDLPTMLRADASFRPIDMIGVGVRAAVPMIEGAPELEPLLTAGVEFRPLRALPLRAGVTGGGDFGTGFYGGFGLDTRAVGFDLELGSAGGPALADIRGVTFRSALSIRF